MGNCFSSRKKFNKFKKINPFKEKNSKANTEKDESDDLDSFLDYKMLMIPSSIKEEYGESCVKNKLEEEWWYMKTGIPKNSDSFGISDSIWNDIMKKHQIHFNY